MATSSTLYLIFLYTQNCSKKSSLKNNSCHMAKANHMWGNQEPDKRHMVDSVGVVTEKDRKSCDRGFTSEGPSWHSSQADARPRVKGASL